jgi:hypothetical protein
VYVFIRENGGWSNFKMEEIEKYPCNNLDEARKREYYWYKILSSKLNEISPWFDIDENKEKQINERNERKQYYLENKEQIDKNKIVNEICKSYIFGNKIENFPFGIFTPTKPTIQPSSLPINQHNGIKTKKDIIHIKMSNTIPIENPVQLPNDNTKKLIAFTDPEVIKFFKTNDLSTPDILVKSLIRNYLVSKEPEKPKPVEPPQIISDGSKIIITHDKLKIMYDEHVNILNQHRKMIFLVKQLCRDFQKVNAQTTIQCTQEIYGCFAKENNIVQHKCDECNCFVSISKKSLSAHKRHCARFMKSKINDEPLENDAGIVEENEAGIFEENDEGDENEDEPIII